MEGAYEFEHHSFIDPLFTTIKIGYIITMKGSKRIHSLLQRLKITPLVEHVFVVWNSGYKNGQKEDVYNCGQDLWHANQTIFSHAQFHKPPILIMEDDIEFIDVTRSKIQEVEHFLQTIDHVDAYSLGCTPLISVPCDQRHMRIFSAFYAHGVIYTARGRKKLIYKHIYRYHDVEALVNIKYYGCMSPIAVQKIVKTENSSFDISLRYARLFGGDVNGNSFFKAHSHMTYIGGSISFYLGCIVMLLVVLYKSKRRFIQFKTTR